MENSRHTILLVQHNPNPASRTYYDYERISDSIDGVIRLFEQKLMNSQPGMAHISYDVSALMQFLDNFHDLACLIFDPQLNAYVPRNKQWIKQQVTRSLERQAGR